MFARSPGYEAAWHWRQHAIPSGGGPGGLRALWGKLGVSPVGKTAALLIPTTSGDGGGGCFGGKSLFVRCSSSYIRGCGGQNMAARVQTHPHNQNSSQTRLLRATPQTRHSPNHQRPYAPCTTSATAVAAPENT